MADVVRVDDFVGGFLAVDFVVDCFFFAPDLVAGDFVVEDFFFVDDFFAAFGLAAAFLPRFFGFKSVAVQASLPRGECCGWGCIVRRAG
ncbi:hypothetical protein [Nannocystis radixulma]|uniref:Uncharacterized protein n=1 Tax=Nannocystis radixulma TaxID=2995305 RepID=A0ABT5B7J0_9BACT|nr:hypothetical protein [Nannocystis radixulma]MDC0670085.1 hypothetical protein [Nannocystis radixulma]